MPSTPVCCLRAFFLSPILVAVLCVCIDARLALAANAVVVATYEGVINPVAAEYFHDALTFADTIRAQAIVLRLDTPGGLDTSMRLMIKDMIGSSIPVVVYIAPSGGRAASGRSRPSRLRLPACWCRRSRPPAPRRPTSSSPRSTRLQGRRPSTNTSRAGPGIRW